MRLLRLVPKNTQIRFIGENRQRVFFAFSMLLVIGSLTLFAVRGLNLGIDFQGGVLLEVRTQGQADISAMRDALGGLGLGEVSLQEFGAPTDVLIRIQRQEGGDEAQQVAVEAARAALDALGPIEYRRSEFVGPTVGAELIEAGTIAVVVSLFAIMVYIWFRFEWQFSVGAIAALAHDVIATIGLFALLQLEFNLSTIAAILTIAGYSINDTVVVYDRVRENLRKFKKMPMVDLCNRSINETLSRTVMTSVTTLLALLALYVFGAEVIRDFSLAMIFGVIIGTYSSVCLAVPLLLVLNVRKIAGEGRTADGTTDPDGPGDTGSQRAGA